MNSSEFTGIYLNLTEFNWTYLNLPEKHEFTWIYLNLPEFAWDYLNLHEFTWIYLSLPKSNSIYLNLPGYIWNYLNLPKTCKEFVHDRGFVLKSFLWHNVFDSLHCIVCKLKLWLGLPKWYSSQKRCVAKEIILSPSYKMRPEIFWCQGPDSL